MGVPLPLDISPICPQDLGVVNHAMFVARGVYRVIARGPPRPVELAVALQTKLVTERRRGGPARESHKLSKDRVVLACLLDVFARGPPDKAAQQQRAQALAQGCVACGRGRGWGTLGPG